MRREPAEVFAAFPPGVRTSDDDLQVCRRDGQVRLWWDTTPIDLFTNTTDHHRAAADRAVVHDFAGTPTPFLSCSDVAVFKAFFNRSKDWVDIETMIEAHTLDVDFTLGVLVRYLEPGDERVLRLRSLVRDRR